MRTIYTTIEDLQKQLMNIKPTIHFKIINNQIIITSQNLSIDFLKTEQDLSNVHLKIINQNLDFKLLTQITFLINNYLRTNQETNINN